jgi:hypothetical protein
MWSSIVIGIIVLVGIIIRPTSGIYNGCRIPLVVELKNGERTH